MPRFLLPLALVAALAACSGRDAPGARPPAEDGTSSSPPPPATTAPAGEWRTNPTGGVTLRGGDTLLIQTGPHIIAWRADARELTPPYTVRAVLQKRTGRLHEGVGLLFGGSDLDAPESRQRYSYFLVRGDGSYLVKRRIGTELPIIRDWTRHPGIRRDAEEGGRPNELEVRVGADEVVFLVNGEEVARVPARELDVRGKPGLRVAHEVQLSVTGFRAGPEAASSTEGR